MFSSYFPPQYSGAAKQAISLAKQLTGLNCEIEFITMQDQGLPKYEIIEGFPVHRIPINGRRNQELPFWPNFYKFAIKNRNRFDILHSHGAHYINSIVGPIGKTVGWKSLVKSTMHNNDLSGLKKSLQGKLHNAFLHTIDAYIGISLDLVDEFKSYGFKPRKIFHIPNGVDTNRFIPVDKDRKRKVRNKLGLPENSLIFLSIGVFDRRKNIGWLIENWKTIRNAHPDSFLLAIGPQSREDKGGVFLKSLKKTASDNINDIRILGHADNIEDYFRAADVFVLPSKNEGLPNVVLEAMASGLPCLTTPASGVSDLVSEGKNGYFFKENNRDEFMKKFALLADSDLAAMGRSARRVAEQSYSIESIANRYKNLFKELLSIG